MPLSGNRCESFSAFFAGFGASPEDAAAGFAGGTGAIADAGPAAGATVFPDGDTCAATGRTGDATGRIGTELAGAGFVGTGIGTCFVSTGGADFTAFAGSTAAGEEVASGAEAS